MNSDIKTLLPVLNKVVGKFRNSDLKFDRMLFVCIQHLLYTTVDLIDALTELGAVPNNIHIMGKIYSSSPKVIKQVKALGLNHYASSMPSYLGGFEEYFLADVKNMWSSILEDLKSKNIDGIIILDDGGKSISSIPMEIVRDYKIFGVEQTASGAAYIKAIKPPFPVIKVASSAAKQHIESHMIAEAVLKKLEKMLQSYDKDLVCGVVGLGVIGQAIALKLLSLGARVIIYDKIESKNYLAGAKSVKEINQLILESDNIFGCAGEDITTNLDLASINKTKTFISCSSQDVEFRSILKFIQCTSFFEKVDVLNDINYSLKNGVNLKIIRGGYPVNLDNSGESVPAHDIQLTRGLLLGGVIQAASLIKEQALERTYSQHMLHPKIQTLVVNEWCKSRRGCISKYMSDYLEAFVDENYAETNSGGIHLYNKLIDDTLCK